MAPISLANVTRPISMYFYIQTASSKNTKPGPCSFCLQTPNESRTAEVFQAAVHGHMCAALIKRPHKASERVNGSCKKAILIVCVFLKKQRSIYRTSQTNQGCGLERSTPSGCSTALAICSLLPGATMYLGWHFLMTGASMCSL